MTAVAIKLIVGSPDAPEPLVTLIFAAVPVIVRGLIDVLPLKQRTPSPVF